MGLFRKVPAGRPPAQGRGAEPEGLRRRGVSQAEVIGGGNGGAAIETNHGITLLPLVFFVDRVYF
jgi:hypothetical protein